MERTLGEYNGYNLDGVYQGQMEGRGDAFWYSLKVWQVKDENPFRLTVYLAEEDLLQAGLRQGQADEVLEKVALWKIRQLIDENSIQRGEDKEWQLTPEVLSSVLEGSA